MILSTRVLGKTIVDQLRARSEAIVLTVGRDTFTRGDLARVRCFNFLAAANLSRALEAILDGVPKADCRYVFDHVPPAALAVRTVGAIALAVLGAAFERKKIGGGAPLEAWIIKHARETPQADAEGLVSFSSLKHAAQQREKARELDGRRRARRSRRASRRDASPPAAGLE